MPENFNKYVLFCKVVCQEIWLYITVIPVVIGGLLSLTPKDASPFFHFFGLTIFIIGEIAVLFCIFLLAHEGILRLNKYVKEKWKITEEILKEEEVTSPLPPKFQKKSKKDRYKILKMGK